MKVLAIILYNSRGELLVTRRPKGKTYGGFLEFPGGKIEAGEEEQKGLLRELKEELNITKLPELRFFHKLRGPSEDPSVQIDLHFYEARLSAEEEAQLLAELRPLEGQDIFWLAPRELRPLDFCPLDSEVLEIIRNSAANLRLYERQSAYIPRIAAVHDLCGYGKCSLATVIPILASAAIDVCSVPTAILSSHTHFTNFTFLDNSDILPEYIEAWSQIAVELDAIYTGFLGSSSQLETIFNLCNKYPKALRFFDPVMGDWGRLYSTYTPDMVEAMQLAATADIITPNLTEAAFLCDMAYVGEEPNDTYLDLLQEALLNLGAKYIILKGVRKNEKISNYIFGQNLKLSKVTVDCLPIQLHGTGDLFASAVLAAIFSECDLEKAVLLASDFVRNALLDSYLQPDYENRGVSFELQLADFAIKLRELRLRKRGNK